MNENTKTEDVPGRDPVLTFGQKAVGLTFNHGEGDVFHQINGAKYVCAEAIDQMYHLRQAEFTENGGSEKHELLTIAIRKLQDAQMHMVKAITWKD